MSSRECSFAYENCLSAENSIPTSDLGFPDSERFQRKILSILLIFACPMGIQHLRLQNEERCIREAIRLNQGQALKISIEVLPACTIDDLSLHFLSNPNRYDVIHFSGHTDRINLLMRNFWRKVLDHHAQVEESCFGFPTILPGLQATAEQIVNKLEIMMSHNDSDFLLSDCASQNSCSSDSIVALSGILGLSASRASPFEFEMTNAKVKLKTGEETVISHKHTYSLSEILNTGIGSLAFEGDGGRPNFVPVKAFAEAMATQTRTKCVVLNACSSRLQGEVVKMHVPFTICFDGRVSDTESVSFSKGFYTALAHGQSYEAAFHEGRTRLDLGAFLPGTPLLFHMTYQ